MEKIDMDWKTTKLKSLAKLFKPFNHDWADLSLVSWISLIQNFPSKLYFNYSFKEHAQIPALTQNKEVNDETLPRLVFGESFQGTWTKS